MDEKEEPYCNRCGGCCKAFIIAVPLCKSLEEIRKKAKGSPPWKDLISFSNGDSWFDFVEEISAEEAEKNGVYEKVARREDLNFGKCNLYEEIEGVGFCIRHEDRPLVCRGYLPRSHENEGYLKSSNEVIHPKCSYLEYFESVAKEKQANTDRPEKKGTQE